MKTGKKRPQFPANHVPGPKGELIGMPIEIFNHFLNYDIMEHIALQINLHSEQKISENSALGKMRRRRRDKDWMETDKNSGCFMGCLLFKELCRNQHFPVFISLEIRFGKRQFLVK